MSKKEKKYLMSEEQRLLLGWTMDLACYLSRKHDMEKKAALEKAHLNRKLMMYLGDGIVVFVYEEEDGTIREARGTLLKGISKAFDTWLRKKKKEDKAKASVRWPRGNFVYWDLDEEAFRSWNASRLIKIKAYTAINCLHDKQ